ncbi:MAG TPA: hypothetical protein VMT10_13710 [Solirubrobacteraceae bacterium]|nr:hypothetical protein [Solirubrobacteraceae bacterium]
MAAATLAPRRRILSFELDSRGHAGPGGHRAVPELDDRGRLTLDELLVGVWEGLRSDRTVACPVCGGAMAPRHGHGPRPVGGRCGGCGTGLA